MVPISQRRPFSRALIHSNLHNYSGKLTTEVFTETKRSYDEWVKLAHQELIKHKAKRPTAVTIPPTKKNRPEGKTDTPIKEALTPTSKETLLRLERHLATQRHNYVWVMIAFLLVVCGVLVLRVISLEISLGALEARLLHLERTQTHQHLENTFKH